MMLLDDRKVFERYNSFVHHLGDDRATEGDPAYPLFDFAIQSHHLIIQIDPSEHLLKAEDRLKSI
jgi:hypothetical protein